MAPPPKKACIQYHKNTAAPPSTKILATPLLILYLVYISLLYAPDMRILSSASDTYWESGGVYNCIINCVPVSDVAGPVIRQSPSTDCSKCPLVVASSLLLVLQSGIHCLTICAIQLLGQTSYDRI